MPPGHGHGGGHGGGGHHHGGHHGGRRPGGWQGGWGPGWSGPGYWGVQPAYAELVVPSCPDTIDPVLATDGRTYLNSCLANVAGARVVKHTSPAKLAGIPIVDKVSDAIRPVFGTATTYATIGLGIGAAYLLYRQLRKRR